jgi:hypothetical protein
LPGVIRLARSSGWQIVVLVYDANAFIAGKNSAKVTAAANPNYVAELEGAGAQVITMPLEGVLGG